jgi:hypothetical protein
MVDPHRTLERIVPAVPLRPPADRWSAFWSALQVLVLIAVPLLLAGLVTAPDLWLRVLWYGVVPVLPATFFLNTTLWRSICPLATLNSWGNRLGTPRPISPRAATALGVGGLILFHLMVPARRFVFNTNGEVLAMTILGVGVLAVVLGSIFAVRSGFCNSLCPVLPVEQLYGQAPLLPMARGRCTTCDVCTSRGCLDLAGGRALIQVIGPGRRTAAWLWTPNGLFIAGLPGFIIGFGVLADGPLRSAPMVYAMTLAWSVASVFMVMALAIGARMDATRLFPLLAGTSGMLFYWYAGPAIADAFAAGDGLAVAIRVVGMGLAGLWLWRAWPISPPQRAVPGMLLAALALGVTPLAGQTIMVLPPRAPDALAGDAMATALEFQPREAREVRIVAEVLAGNVPSWWRRLVPVTMVRRIGMREITVRFEATPDYLAVGSDEDWFLMPLSPEAAGVIGAVTDTRLPTPVMVDAIWRGAAVRLGPDSIAPSAAMVTMPVFADHMRMIRARRTAAGAIAGDLVAGHKKDVVQTPRLDTLPGRVAIYGWHRPDGRPIQPLYTGHASSHVDYSHGIRLVSRHVMVDGVSHDLDALLRDPVLAAAVRDTVAR